MHQDLRLEKAATKAATSEYAADAICWTECSSKSMQLVFCDRGWATNNVRNYLVTPMWAKKVLQQVSRLRRGFCPRVAKPLFQQVFLLRRGFGPPVPKSCFAEGGLHKFFFFSFERGGVSTGFIVSVLAGCVPKVPFTDTRTNTYVP